MGLFSLPKPPNNALEKVRAAIRNIELFLDDCVGSRSEYLLKYFALSQLREVEAELCRGEDEAELCRGEDLNQNNLLIYLETKELEKDTGDWIIRDPHSGDVRFRWNKQENQRKLDQKLKEDKMKQGKPNT